MPARKQRSYASDDDDPTVVAMHAQQRIFQVRLGKTQLFLGYDADILEAEEGA